MLLVYLFGRNWDDSRAAAVAVALSLWLSTTLFRLRFFLVLARSTVCVRLPLPSSSSLSSLSVVHSPRMKVWPCIHTQRIFANAVSVVTMLFILSTWFLAFALSFFFDSHLCECRNKECTNNTVFLELDVTLHGIVPFYRRPNQQIHEHKIRWRIKLCTELNITRRFYQSGSIVLLKRELTERNFPKQRKIVIQHDGYNVGAAEWKTRNLILI